MKLDLIVGIYMYIKWIISGYLGGGGETILLFALKRIFYGRNYVTMLREAMWPFIGFIYNSNTEYCKYIQFIEHDMKFLYHEKQLHTICPSVKLWKGGGYKEIIFELEWNKNEALSS